MRKPLIGLLLASAVAIPSAVSAQEGESNRRAAHYERLEQRNQQRYEQRQQRQEQRVEQRQQQAEQPQPAPEQRQQRIEQRQQRQEVREQRIEQRQDNWQGNRERGAWRGRGDGQAQQQVQQEQEQVQQQQQQQQTRQSWQDRRGQGRSRQGGGYQGGGWQQQPSTGGSGPWVGDPNDPRMERHRRRYEQLERRNQRDWQRDGDRDGRDWDRNDRNRGDRWGRNDRRWDRQWRNDRRYDWYSYRNNYRDLYRGGRYYDPYGYGYRRFSIGIRIGQPFYQQRYWISDPWRYRLPDAGPGYAWVRYYNDVLLIDTWSGEVVDVIYDFFW